MTRAPRLTAVALAMLSLATTDCASHRSAALPKIADVAVAPVPQLAAAPADKPCGGIAKELGRLQTKMRIEAYVTHGTPALESFARDLETRLESYRDAAGGKLEIAVFDAAEEGARQRAREAGLQEQSFGGDEESSPRGPLGLVISYEKEHEAIKAFTPDTSGIDFWIVSKMREVRERAHGVHHDIGVLTGHGEPSLDDHNLVPGTAGPRASLQSILAQYFPSYRLVKVDLRGGAEVVPEALEGLIVLQPARDLPDAELARIDAFVTRGKALAVFASAVNVDTKMKATLGRHGLDRLVSGYGIDIHEDLVIDYGQPFKVKVAGETGLQTIILPQVADVRRDDGALDVTSIPFFRLSQVFVPYASSVTVSPAKQPAARVALVARSSARASVVTARTSDLSLTHRFAVREPLVQVGLAATASGRLRSAFGGATSQAPAKVFVVASSSFLANPFAVASASASTSPHAEVLGAIGNQYAQDAVTSVILIFKNTLDWMGGDEDLAACTAEIAPKTKP